MNDEKTCENPSCVTWRRSHEKLYHMNVDYLNKVHELRQALGGLLEWAENNHEMPNYSEVILKARQAMKPIAPLANERGEK